MNDDFNDRLLEESLKQYSRVSPPEDFEVRLPAERPGLSRWWLLVPAAAVLATTLLLLPRPAPQRPALQAAYLPPVPLTGPTRTVGARRAVPLRPRFRMLTGRELAHLSITADLFAQPEEKPMKDLEVPDLEIKPLAGSEEPGTPKE